MVWPRVPRAVQMLLPVLVVQLGLLVGAGLLVWVLINGPNGHWIEIPVVLGTCLLLVLSLWSSVAVGFRWRKQAEQGLQEAHDQYRHLVDSIEGIVWEADAIADTTLFVSRKAEQLLGYPVEDWYADLQFWRNHLHPDDRERCLAQFTEGQAALKPFSVEYRLIRKDGEAVWLRDIVSVTVMDGKPVRMNGVMVDITERKRAEEALNTALREIQVREVDLTVYKNHLEELVMTRTGALIRANTALRVAWEKAEESNRMKSSFLANMSHELRTPLNAIILFSELILDEVQAHGPNGAAEDLGKIQNAGKHLLSLIDNILDLSKIEAGRVTLSFEDTDVADTIQEIAMSMTPVAEMNGNRLIVDLEPDLPIICTDQTRVRQILINLVGNASKFTSQGTITLGARMEKTEARILFQVRDTGIGMNKEQQARIFQRFAQADDSTTRKFGGTGLGLALSQGLTELLGGKLWVESEEGKGSVFYLSLPTRVTVRDSA
jgi:PAS domain S-box-containing protein